MNPFVELNLAFILFLPWYALLGWLFWRFTGHGAPGSRKLASCATLIAALAAAAVSGVWAYGHADINAGPIWKQVLPAAVAYPVFLGVLLAGWLVLRRRRTG